MSNNRISLTSTNLMDEITRTLAARDDEAEQYRKMSSRDQSEYIRRQRRAMREKEQELEKLAERK